MMFAIYNRKRYRVLDEDGVGVRLELHDEDGPETTAAYNDGLLLLDPTDNDWRVAGAGEFHHQDEWGRDLCCPRGPSFGPS
jgi:hypothetical protein